MPRPGLQEPCIRLCAQGCGVLLGQVQAGGIPGSEGCDAKIHATYHKGLTVTFS